MTALQSSFFEAETLEEVNRLVMEKGWGDGLPVVPPTEDRVLAMLAHTGDDPGRVMGEMPPLNGEATVEKVAINAVMAGCKPEYFPIVLAMVEAVLELPFNMNGVATTTNPSAPVVMINGPIRREVGVNCGIGCFGPGTQANATTGRSLRLIMQTLGGATPGPVAKAVLSLPERYTFCFGEDEERTPWTPLHVERGFDPDTSTVTVVSVNVLLSTTAAILYDKAHRFAEIVGQTITLSGNPNLEPVSQPVVVIPWNIAQRIDDQGVSKQQLKELFFEHSRFPADQVPEYELWREYGLPPFHLTDGYIQPVETPDEFVIVVAGDGLPAYAAIMPSFYATKAVTKPVRAV